MPSKCIGCEKNAKTKKGWCSIECYRNNQHLIENNGRFKLNKISYNKKYDIITKKCNVCGINFQCKDYNNNNKYYGYGKYCSNKCSSIGRTITPIVNCSNCKKKIRKKVGKSGLVYCCKDCYNEYRKNNIIKRIHTIKKIEKIKLICKICGKEYERYPNNSKNSKYCSRQCHSIGNVLNMPKKNTSIEIKFKKILCDLNINHITQKPISNITICDFFIEPNIVIYVDGDYWHNLPDVIKRDIKINKYLLENNYKVVRYKENIINNNISIIKKELKNYDI